MGDMHQNLIGGVWVDGDSVTHNLNPANPSDEIGVFARASAADVSTAVAAAAEALPGWALATPQVRADVLENVAQAILARADELGTLLAREEGKTLAEAKGEVIRAAQIFRFFAGEAVRIKGAAGRSIRPGVDVEVSREPVGVVGIVTPWNFPIAIPAWKIAPALAYGNTVVFKPADLTPASAHALVQIVHDAGAPAGAINLVMGRGSVVGDAIVTHPEVAAISFTGSVPVGRGLAVQAAQGMKKIQLEMGGKNPTIVTQSADLDAAVAGILNAAFFSTGQRCTATSRIIVDKAVHDGFVAKFRVAMENLNVGDPLDPKVQIGPVVSESQLTNNLNYVALAAKEGAEVIGGSRCGTDGFMQAPALFLNAANDMRICQEEIFGPCAAIISVDDFDEAVAVANDTSFGLSSGIYTQSLSEARAFKRMSKAGMTMVNLPTAGVDYHVPFGGTKGSSLGAREQGANAIEFYTTVKTIYESD
jgi:aldehyde dehydrogenase (NAD+)